MHLRFRAIAVVFVGGAVGTAARAWLGEALPPLNGVPITILVINVAGAFLLGLLLESLVRRGPATVRQTTVRQTRLRLLLGTGFLGGFTTYSALSVDIVELLTAGRLGMAAVYGLGSVVLGLLAAAAGVAIGTRAHRTST